ncbi:MAG TPA: cupin domain-containing protein [Gemmataceae bacterium]|nr:cupin domain-containing protein [Gemmataceae bacterium]
MQRARLGVLAVVLASTVVPAFAQSGKPPESATVVSAAEIEKVVSAPGGGDREIKILDLGKYNIGIAVLRRGATKPGAPLGAINHTKVTEVYYVVSGSGTLITGGEVKDIKPIAADSELVTTVVGPGNNAMFVKPATSQVISTGDVVVIPAGVYHGFSEVPDHIEYVSVRPDPEKALPAGYVNPALKK